MFNAEKTVFISYRRSVSKFIARCVFQDLHYNGYDVFLDVENINNGTFENIILNQIAARAHFLVILTPGTLERCAEPGDWLRREIEFAMDLKRNIIPVMVDDFDFNASLPFLTGKLVHLQSYNGLRLRYEFFDDSMRKLRNHFLKQPVYSEIFPAPPEDRAAVQEIINKATDEPFPTQNEVQAESFLMRGLQKWAAGDLDGAIADYDEAIRLNPHDCDAYSNRAVVRQSRGDLAGALADYDRAIKHTPKEGLAFVYINRGMVRADLGDVEGAIADYSSAIQHNSESASAYYIRGNARFNKGDLDGAIVDYDRVVMLNPQFSDAYFNRGLVRGSQGDWEGAIEDYTEAITLSPHRADAYYHRGLARRVGGDHEGAKADFTEAIRRNPQDKEAYFYRSLVRYQQGDFEGSIQDCSRILELAPRSVQAYIQRGNAYLADGKPGKAVADYTEAIRLNPSYYNAYNNRGEAHFALGKRQQALADFKQAFRLSGGKPITLGGLAISFHALGDVEKARYCWKKLAGQSRFYRDVNWVRQEFNWSAPLVEEARKLIVNL